MTNVFQKLHQDILSIAALQSTPSSQDIAVDKFTGFNDRFMDHDVHYNKAGAVFIAYFYYAKLKKS